MGTADANVLLAEGNTGVTSVLLAEGNRGVANGSLIRVLKTARGILGQYIYHHTKYTGARFNIFTTIQNTWGHVSSQAAASMSANS